MADATFSTPVSLTAGATYVASYHTNVGHYSSSEDYFASNVTSGPLTAPASGNGVYTYGGTSAFPTSTFSATNFWVDVMFNPSTANSSAGGRGRHRADRVTEFGLDDHGGVLDRQ